MAIREVEPASLKLSKVKVYTGSIKHNSFLQLHLFFLIGLKVLDVKLFWGNFIISLSVNVSLTVSVILYLYQRGKQPSYYFMNRGEVVAMIKEVTTEE